MEAPPRPDFTLSVAEQWGQPGGPGSTWGVVQGTGYLRNCLKYFDPWFSCTGVSWSDITPAHWTWATTLAEAPPQSPGVGTYSSWVSKAEK